MGIHTDKIRVVTAENPVHDLATLGAEAAGVVLCGGPDLDPRWYGEKPRDDADLSIWPELDQMDWSLLEGAEQGRTPVWAICRGMQTFNVFQGGTLWQDLPSQVQGVIEHQPDVPHDSLAHSIRILTRQETFAELLNGGAIEVNSRHHQAVRDTGRDIVQVAESADGVLEVLVLDRPDWWVKGVQWHPENLMHVPVQRQLWAEFLVAADTRSRQEFNTPILD